MKFKKINKLVENVEIIDISSEGKAVAKIDGLVVFVEGAVPGDIGDLLITKQSKNFSEGILSNLKQPSVHRLEPKCSHFGTCGGCKWQHFNYAAQMQFKQKYVFDALTRIGKIDIPNINPIIGNEDAYYYRNKLEFSFSDKKWLTKEEIESAEPFNRNALGFHIPGMFDKILDINTCYLQPEPSNSIRLAIKQYALDNDLSFFNVRGKHGLLRTLLIRTTSTGEVMVLLSFFENNEAQIAALMAFLKIQFPQVTSLQYTINSKANDTLQDLEIITYSGRSFIYEEMEGLRFKISAKSFYQTNSQQAYKLYNITRQYAKINPTDTVYDLYTGTGTIANFVAKQAHKVIGVEYVADAVIDAKENSNNNSINNTSFFAGDMKDVLNPAFITEHGKPHVIITDPPRAGMHEDVVNTILNIESNRVVYVSCNPATQARDLAMMDAKYKITDIQPVDMFPQTAHVENVVALELR